MMTVNLRRYSDPDTLKEISPRLLVALMDEHREFLAARGIELPPVSEEVELNYETLATIFLSPDDIPPELVEKFHMVKLMSSPATMDKILDTVQSRQLPLAFPQDSSPEDVAAILLLREPALFQELCAERGVAKFRSFVYFVARRKRANWRPPVSMEGLERTLNSWYEAHQRARSAKVFWRQVGSEYWFFVRHAEPIKRDGCVGLRDFVSGSTIYRPERHDVVVYDAQSGELRIHGDCPKETEVFRLAFGLHLFDDGNYFPKSRAKYTLDPLKLGRLALTWRGIPSVLEIVLKEIAYRGHGENAAKDRLAASDVFRIFEARQFILPADADIRMARFSVLFQDAKKPRCFTIRPSNFATFSQDDDAVVLRPWLERQGFVLPNRDETTNDGNWTLEYS